MEVTEIPLEAVQLTAEARVLLMEEVKVLLMEEAKVLLMEVAKALDRPTEVVNRPAKVMEDKVLAIVNPVNQVNMIQLGMVIQCQHLTHDKIKLNPLVDTEMQINPTAHLAAVDLAIQHLVNHLVHTAVGHQIAKVTAAVAVVATTLQAVTEVDNSQPEVDMAVSLAAPTVHLVQVKRHHRLT